MLVSDWSEYEVSFFSVLCCVFQIFQLRNLFRRQKDALNLYSLFLLCLLFPSFLIQPRLKESRGTWNLVTTLNLFWMGLSLKTSSNYQNSNEVSGWEVYGNSLLQLCNFYVNWKLTTLWKHLLHHLGEIMAFLLLELQSIIICLLALKKKSNMSLSGVPYRWKSMHLLP